MDSTIFIIANLVTSFVSAWAVVRPRFLKTFWTKCMVAVLSLTTFSIAGCKWVYYCHTSQSEYVLSVLLAMLSARCFYVKEIKPILRRRRKRCN